jgi:hypothetical protein
MPCARVRRGRPAAGPSVHDADDAGPELRGGGMRGDEDRVAGGSGGAARDDVPALEHAAGGSGSAASGKPPFAGWVTYPAVPRSPSTEPGGVTVPPDFPFHDHLPAAVVHDAGPAMDLGLESTRAPSRCGERSRHRDPSDVGQDVHPHLHLSPAEGKVNDLPRFAQRVRTEMPPGWTTLFEEYPAAPIPANRIATDNAAMTRSTGSVPVSSFQPPWLRHGPPGAASRTAPVIAGTIPETSIRSGVSDGSPSSPPGNFLPAGALGGSRAVAARTAQDRTETGALPQGNACPGLPRAGSSRPQASSHPGTVK